MSPPKHSIHLGRLLDELVEFIGAYVVVSEAQAAALALWVAHTHALEAFETTAFLVVTSPEKRCGKTRLLDVLELVVARAWRTIMPSEAVLYRKIEAVTPTLLLDETDAIFSAKNANTEPLRALLNAGNRRGTAVPRCVGPTQQLVDFQVFCAKALAGIGDLPDTVEDRSIVIRMARKKRDETALRFRRREALEAAEPIHQALASWAQDAVVDLEAARPRMPEDALDDRAEEAWEPLLAIAELAGGGWPERARSVALGLSTGADHEDESLGAWLLRDIYTVFNERGVDRFSSADLAAALSAIETSPWGDIRGRPLDGRALARRLRTFSVRPRTVRFHDQTRGNGYLLEQFQDAFARYVADFPRDGVTTAWLSQNEGDFERDMSRSETGRKASSLNDCHGVTAKNGENGPQAVPLPGDSSFLDFLADAHSAGWITTGEALEREQTHTFIVRTAATA